MEHLALSTAGSYRDTFLKFILALLNARFVETCSLTSSDISNTPAPASTGVRKKVVVSMRRESPGWIAT